MVLTVGLERISVLGDLPFFCVANALGKVFKKLHISLSKQEIDDLVQCQSGAIEHLLVKLQIKVHSRNCAPEA